MKFALYQTRTMKKQYQYILLVSILVLMTAVWRVLNAEFHIYHLVPIASLGLLSGSMLQDKKWAYIIPLAAMFLSDIGMSLFTNIQGFYGVSQVVNYMALALVTLLGTQLVKRNLINIAGYSVAGSLVFFLISNFGTFLSGYYGYSFSSLIECYAMAIPFYKSEMASTFFMNSILADLLFSTISFGVIYLTLLSKTTKLTYSKAK